MSGWGLIISATVFLLRMLFGGEVKAGVVVLYLHHHQISRGCYSCTRRTRRTNWSLKTDCSFILTDRDYFPPTEWDPGSFSADRTGVYLLLYTIEINQECICCYILSRYIRSVFAAIYYQDISGVDNVILHQDPSGVWTQLLTMKMYQEV